MRSLEPIQPIKLINAVNISSFDEQVVYLFLEDVIFSNDAVQHLLEEHNEASPVVDLFVGSSEEGYDFKDAWCDTV